MLISCSISVTCFPLLANFSSTPSFSNILISFSILPKFLIKSLTSLSSFAIVSSISAICILIPSNSCFFQLPCIICQDHQFHPSDFSPFQPPLVFFYLSDILICKVHQFLFPMLKYHLLGY